MALIATKVSAGRHHLTYRLTKSNGAIVSTVIANSVLLTDMVDGPLQDAWNRGYGTLAAKQEALMGRSTPGFCSVSIQLDVQPVDAAATVTPQVLVSDDLVTVTKANIAFMYGSADVDALTSGWLYLIHDHTAIQ